VAAGGDAARFRLATLSVSRGTRLFITLGGELGLGPTAMMEGDVACVLFGGRLPFVLRDEGGWYRLVGECYIRRYMDEAAVKRWSGVMKDFEFPWGLMCGLAACIIISLRTRNLVYVVIIGLHRYLPLTDSCKTKSS
jgi:hypothetical protein